MLEVGDAISDLYTLATDYQTWIFDATPVSFI